MTEPAAAGLAESAIRKAGRDFAGGWDFEEPAWHAPCEGGESYRSHRNSIMYHHIKSLMYAVRVGTPDPAFGNMLLEQFGGAIGELAAALQYSIQRLNCEDAARKDM